MNMFSYFWYFFIYAFLGWCVEVGFAAFKNGRFVNRGFLNGPICPIYGFGLVFVLLCLEPLKDNLLYLYVGSVVITSLIELITGFVMEKLFHQRWWDYSKMPLNIGGYVCLLFSLVWGAACMVIVLLIHPLFVDLVALIPHTLSIILLSLLGALFVTDIVVSIATALKLNKRLTQIDEVSASIKKLSDGIGETISGGALTIKAENSKLQEDLQQRRDELSEKRAALTERMQTEQARLLNAFPNIRSLKHRETLEDIKQKLAERRKQRKDKKTTISNEETPKSE